MGQNTLKVLRNLIAQRLELEAKIEEITSAMPALVSEMTLEEVASFHSDVQVHTVWEKDPLSVVLLVSKPGSLAGCGILLWGSQLKFNPSCLAIKIHESVVRFAVFDGGTGGDMRERYMLIESLKAVCEKVGVRRIFAKNAQMLESGGALWKMTEDIENFYMLIAKSDGTLISEFNFIDPQASSAFWSNNG